jgi:diguanylate cyclase (GGDEF)-like protein/PAS domain S-box-containing protein
MRQTAPRQQTDHRDPSDQRPEPNAVAPGHSATPGASEQDLAWLLNEIIHQSPIGIAVIDVDGIYRNVNAAYGNLYGYTERELIGRSFTIVFAPENHRRVLQRHKAFLNGSNETGGEFEVVCRDGSTKTIISNAVRLEATGGGAPMRLVYVIDITERKLAERKLESARAFTQSVLDGLSAQVCVIDERGTIVSVNRTWRAFNRANGGERFALNEGADYLEVCRHFNLAGTPDIDASPEFLAGLKSVMAGDLATFEFEYPCHWLTEQRWFIVRMARLAASDRPRIVLSHYNITSVKRLQQELAGRESLLADLAASIPGAMFRSIKPPGAEARFSFVSAGIEDLIGVTPQAIYASRQLAFDRILDEDRAEYDDKIRIATLLQSEWRHEFRVRGKNDSIKWLSAQAQSRVGDDGSLTWTGFILDITARKKAEAALSASEARYRTLFETVPQGVVYHDKSMQITSANPAAQRILGLTLEQLQRRQSVDARWKSIREDGSDFPGSEHPAMVAARTLKPVKDVVMGVAVPDRGFAWLKINAIPLLEAGELKEVYATFEDITAQVLLTHELRAKATTDELTRLANRRTLFERLAIEYERVQRNPGLRCCLLAIDIDHFKRVNDTWGHAAGDVVLKHVAQTMKMQTRRIDMAARIGGEEFIILLPDTSVENAQALAERIRASVENTSVSTRGHQIAVTISIGLSAINPDDRNDQAALERADLALYEAKHHGRNRVRLDPSLSGDSTQP